MVRPAVGADRDTIPQPLVESRMAVDDSQRRDRMKLREGQGLTTREVARILGVSIATVKRYFDKGTLTGWKNR